MTKTLLAVLVAATLTLVSCRTAVITPILYNPNPLNVTDPLSVIRVTIEQQPAAYAYLPTRLEVDEECIKLYMESSRPVIMPIVGGRGGVVVGPGVPTVSVQPLCYRNMGRVGLSYVERDRLWRVEIDDRSGNYMYWVFSYEKSAAERFMDAIHHFVKMGNQ